MKNVVHGGFIQSEYDGDWHIVSPHDIAKLCGLPRGSYTIGESLPRYGMYVFSAYYYGNERHFWPEYRGRRYNVFYNFNMIQEYIEKLSLKKESNGKID